MDLTHYTVSVMGCMVSLSAGGRTFLELPHPGHGPNHKGGFLSVYMGTVDNNSLSILTLWMLLEERPRHILWADRYL